MRLKHLLFNAFIASLVCVVGCEKGPKEDNPTPSGGEGLSRFSATIAPPELSRVMLSGQDVTWGVGDTMLTLSYNGNTVQQAKSTIDAQSINGTTAQFNLASGRSLDASAENYALYPYFQAKLADIRGGSQGNRTIKLSLPEQTLSVGQTMTMPLLVGKWSDNAFVMHNPLLVVRLNLTLPAEQSALNLSRVDVESCNNELLWGSAATFNTADMALAINAEGGTKRLTLECEGKTLDSKGLSVSFCIPAAKYAKGLKLKFYFLEGVYQTTIGAEGIDLSNDSILEQNLAVNIVKSDIFADVVRATDTTVVVAWSGSMSNMQYFKQPYPNASASYAQDVTKDYKVAIYSDEECANLVYSVSPLKGASLFTDNSCPPRFIFTGLEPKSDYYVHIHNLTDSKQTLVPLRVTTSAPAVENVAYTYTKPGDVVLFENFGELIYAGDTSARAAGVSRDDRALLTSFEGADLKGEITLDLEADDDKSTTEAVYIPATAQIEIGLFNSLKGLVDDMGLDKWGWIGGKEGANGGSVAARPGYLKVGTGGNRSAVVTPMLSAIPAGVTATVTVKFKAAPYGDVGKDINPDEKSILVKVLDDTSLSSAYKVTYNKEGQSKAFTLEGNNSSVWKEYSATFKGVSSTSRISIGGGRASATDTNRFLLDDVRVVVDSLDDTSVVTGTVSYSDGTPAAGVVVSDGFGCVQTDVNGKYSFKPHKDTFYIYYSIPSDCEVEVNDHGQPYFFAKYSDTKSVYDFTLEKSAVKQNKFALFCLADVQCANQTQYNRFKFESTPDLKDHASRKGMPCYGVTLGDVVYSQGTRNCDDIMPIMRNLMSKSVMGFPIFQTMGNHDYTYFGESKPIEWSGSYDYELNIKLQRAFERVFGPINYSWNRADAHIISMRNMQWWDGASWDHYNDPMFTNEQYEWLKQDLQYVPKDKMVILCVHCSVWNSTKLNVQNVLKLLAQFKEAHIMSGHHHRNTNEPTKSTINGKAIYEHNHGAVCGSFWYSNVNADGSPNGYGVYEIEGNKMVNWYYKGVNDGMNDQGYQMRLYRGNMRCGGQYDYIQLQHGKGVILANVFNADPSWTVKVFEDGVYTGNMTLMPQYNGSTTAGTSEASPCKPSTSSSLDWWAIGYHTGVLGKGYGDAGKRNGQMKECTHMYKYTLKNSSAKDIRVEATDQWGNVYKSSEIMGDYDYTLM